MSIAAEQITATIECSLASRFVLYVRRDGIDREHGMRHGREREVDVEHRVVLQVGADGEGDAARGTDRFEHRRKVDSRELEELLWYVPM